MDAVEKSPVASSVLSSPPGLSQQKNQIKTRPPSHEEKEFFNRTGIPGYAAEDDSVVLNPIPPAGVNMDAVRKNETLRILMRRGDLPKPSFALTDEQIKKFSRYGSEQDIRETISARIATGDPSVSDATKEQLSFVKHILELHK